MTLVNAAATTINKLVVPASIDVSPACLDACQCADPDSCRYEQ